MQECCLGTAVKPELINCKYLYETCRSWLVVINKDTCKQKHFQEKKKEMVGLQDSLKLKCVGQ